MLLIFQVINAILSAAKTASEKASLVSAKNSSTVVNAGFLDYQKIRTAKIELPIIMVSVLEYAPGELGTTSDLGRDGAKVLYGEASLKDKDFLESVKASPLQIETHEKNTSEYNIDIDGWLTDVWYDDIKKGVFGKGYVKGDKNIEYVEKHRNDPNFGTSAYIDFIGVKKENGVTGTGDPFDAVTQKLSCNHLAILPNIRDPKNRIVAMNAMQEVKDEIKKEEGSTVEDKIDKEALRNALEDIKNEDAVKTGYDKMSESVKNMADRLDKLEGFMNKNAKNADEEKEDEAKNEKDDVLNEEGVKVELEKEIASNAIPSQNLIKDISDMLDVTFKKVPSFLELGKLLQIEGKTLPETIAAVNAKRAEYKSVSVVNSVSTENSKSSFFEALERI